ncbi:HNH endonuclease [Salmonella enterica subsp. salamae]|uniref:HNH endonuclease n=1 Tax=Salmonella enterica subsp. salamae TaxID=59202 RepID=A0A8E6MHZ9_SALER|nr:HNH endonuclease [Salmonella enterica subsp. salamae]
MITKKRVDEVLHFDEETAEFTWKIYRGGTKKVGDKAGTLDSKGYRQIRIDGVTYLAHRLVWLIKHGEWPQHHIDHIDRNHLNNHPSNLRKCTHAENHQNIPVRKDNSSGVTGVSYVKRSKKWLAYIYVNGKAKRLGLYENFNDAVMARIKAKKHYHTFHPHQ